MSTSTGDDVQHNQMANAIRFLSMDAVQQAKSGHPGMPMGMADVATVLYTKYLKFDPSWPTWPDRDRFILSAGHGSMLMYSLLHLTGYESPTMDDIRNFRQLGSPTAGHPEYDELAGVECTTGPLGQGLTMAVGFALAERLEAARSGDGFADHHTYVICGDGCLMEGISHEAISMAGHLGLGKLIVFWDDNSISIDGPTDLSVSDDQGKRFDACGWHTQAIDGHDRVAVAKAIEAAQADDRPSMIACKTVIGFGAPTKAGTAGAHGAPLGPDEIAGARKTLGWDAAPFDVPEDILDAWRATGDRGAEASSAWADRFGALDLDVKAELERRLDGRLPDGFADAINDYKKGLAENPVKMATRKASQMALEVINGVVPETIGGSADLTGSNNTNTSQTLPITAQDFSGRYMYYGVREFAMAAAMNGLALHGGFIPYGGTFMVFTDYCRPAMRLAALMGQRVIYVMTHDSIGLGEDGPTHQPVEHLMSLRAMPNMLVLRPADPVETAECWQLALEHVGGPTMIALTRQSLEPVRTTHTDDNLCARGGYVLREADGDAQVTLIASGSEIEIAVAAQAALKADGIAAKVVSLVSWELFDVEDEDYRAQVLGHHTLKVSIEAGSTFGWERYIGKAGIAIGIDSFGASAPATDLYKHFGITTDAVVDAVKSRL